MHLNGKKDMNNMLHIKKGQEIYETKGTRLIPGTPRKHNPLPDETSLFIMKRLISKENLQK